MRRRARKNQGETPIPPGVIKPGTLSRRPRRSVRSVVLPVAGVALVILVALGIVGALGSSDDGNDTSDRGGKSSNGKKEPAPTTTHESPAVAGQPTTTSASSGASVALRATDDVWVCLIDDAGNKLVNSETLTAGEKRGPFDATGFQVTLGNGSVNLTANGEPSPVPAVAQPIGYRITPTEVKKLSPSAQPDCL